MAIRKEETDRSDKLKSKKGKIMTKTKTVESGLKLTEASKGILSTTTQVDDLIETFARDKNVRDAELGYRDQEDTLVSQLIEIGHVVEPVLVATRPQELTEAEFKKLDFKDQIKALLPISGFRRVNLSHQIVHNVGDLNPGYGDFDPIIPVRIEFGLSEKEIMERKMNHGSIKGLNEWELVLCLMERFAKGESESALETIYVLRNLFDSHQAIGKRKELAAKIKQMDHRIDPVANLNAKKEIIRKHYYGRYQKLERIAKARDQRLRDNFRAEVYDTGEALRITNEQYVKLYKLKGEEYDAMIKEITEDRTRQAEITKAKRWSKKDMETKIEIWGSDWIATILKACYGDEEAQKACGAVAKKIAAVEIFAKLEPEKMKEIINS